MKALRLHRYDLGYGLALAYGRRVLARVHLPFPTTLASWKYLFRSR